MARILLGACLASTWFMAGLIWFVQVVHYPLFDHVGGAQFPGYHRLHTRRTTWVVVGPMVVELITAIGLVLHPPRSAGPTLPWIGLIAAVLCWASTALLQVPLHERLATEQDPLLIVRLVRSNLIRTLSWSTHALVVLIIAIRSMPDY